MQWEITYILKDIGHHMWIVSVCIYQKVIFYWWDDGILSVVMETIFFIIINMCLITQSCLTLCNQMGCSPAGSSVHGDSPGKNTGVGCHALFRGIFPTQGLNLVLLHCRWILYHLNLQRSPNSFCMLYSVQI